MDQHTSATQQMQEHFHHPMVILSIQTIILYILQRSPLLLQTQGLHKTIMNPILKHLIPAFHLLEVPSIHLIVHTLKKQEA